MKSIPNDADGDAMRRVINGGSDLTQPMSIDFSIACLDEKRAIQIADKVKTMGYEPSISKDPSTGSITCCAAKSMLLDYDLLLVAQHELDAASAEFEGHIDGWGTFGNIQI